MTKAKSPLLSLGAHGTIGDALTFQERSGTDFVRRKPVPFDRKTLAQMYQRWDYEDYAYLWTQLSVAEKEAWRSTATLKGLSPFNAFMSDRLTRLPDLVGRWHLDEASGILVQDTSRNSNTGTIFGASLTDGLISNGRLFDGINDRIVVPNDTSLHLGTDFTIEFFCYPLSSVYRDNLFGHGLVNQQGWFIDHYNDLSLRMYINQAAAHQVRRSTPGSLVLNTWQHYAFVKKGTAGYWYKNAIDITFAGVALQNPATPITDFFMGFYWPTYYLYEGRLDEIRFYNRALSQPELLRHSLRRYPLQ